MRRFWLLALALLLASAPVARAQDEAQAESTEDAAASEAPAETAPEEDASEPKPREFTDMPQVRLRILDKVRAESRTYDLDVGHTVAYANLRLRPRSCRSSSPLDDPEDAAFLQIWEVLPDGKSAWVFSGWMFGSSPSLSAMDHAVYDVTVLDCRDPNAESQQQTVDEAPADTGETAPEDAAAGFDAVLDNALADEAAADTSAETAVDTEAEAQPESTNETPASDSATDNRE